MSVGFSAIRRAATSFSTNKLNKIIGDLKYDADELAKMALIIEAKKAMCERRHARLERDDAGLERIETRAERRAAQKWHMIQQ
jgi:hypothetical protein